MQRENESDQRAFDQQNQENGFDKKKAEET